MRLFSVFCMLAMICGCSTGPTFPEVTEFSVADESFAGKIKFKKLTTTEGFKVLLETSTGETDQMIFRYKPYRFDTADVDRDGNTEVIVGLIKATHFDPIEMKRLFILKIDDNNLRPLWLGSKVCQELIDFKVLSNGTIQTLERTSTGGYSIGKYYWQSFGLTLEKYIHHETNFNYATQLFKQ